LGKSRAWGAFFRTRPETDALSVADSASPRLGRAYASGHDRQGARSREDFRGPRSPLRFGNVAGKHRNPIGIGVDLSITRPTEKNLKSMKHLLLDSSPSPRPSVRPGEAHFDVSGGPKGRDGTGFIGSILWCWCCQPGPRGEALLMIKCKGARRHVK